MRDIAAMLCDGTDRKSEAALSYIHDTAEAWYSDVEIPTPPPHSARVRYSARAAGAGAGAGAGSTGGERDDALVT